MHSDPIANPQPTQASSATIEGRCNFLGSIDFHSRRHHGQGHRAEIGIIDSHDYAPHAAKATIDLRCRKHEHEKNHRCVFEIHENLDSSAQAPARAALPARISNFSPTRT